MISINYWITNIISRLDAIVEGVNLALYVKLSETATKNLQDNFLECKVCGQIFNTGLESTIPGEPGLSEKVLYLW